MWARAVAFWKGLKSDGDARFDREMTVEASAAAPHVTWGTSPEHVVPVTARVPAPDDEPDPVRRAAMARSLDYMCLAMNADRLGPGERSASTSSRNFEGRQGAGGRTHLMSPQMAAAAAVQGCITDVRELLR